MLQNKRKTIGVFAEKVKEEFQMRLCQGIIEEAELQGYNVAIFTNYGKYGQNNQHFIGDQMIWDLPCYEEFAGLILALDTMSEKSSRQKILDNVKKYCHCPVVSIREKVEGAVNFLVENTTGMAGLIRHFIELHGKKRLCFMSGPKTYWDARERMQCFLDTMKEYGLPVTEHQMFYGDYWYNMGAQACDWFLAEDEMPEVIMCANDHMALAVVSELIKRGIRVPEDICVSGYDGLLETLSFTPAITTMRVPFQKMGKQAVELIAENQETEDWKKIDKVCFEAEILARESCGCMAKAGEKIILEKQREYDQLQAEQNRATQFDYMSIYLSQAESIEDKMKTLIDELAYMYDRDELTDWYNRRGLEKQGVRLLEQAKQEKSPLFLCVIDLDGMKQINDNFGHIEGDFALKKVCETISGACRGEYLCARTGGDEFVVLAKNVTEMEGRAWMLKMEKELEKFNKTSEKPYAIHASYGITSRVPEETESMQQYIKESDEKMYRYKVMNKKRRGEELR